MLKRGDDSESYSYPKIILFSYPFVFTKQLCPSLFFTHLALEGMTLLTNDADRPTTQTITLQK
jgi:hypothetical protein